MIWEPAAVYGFVRAARFRTEQWAPAVALALASSAGDDGYRDVPAIGRGVDRRGLFAIDVVAHPELADRDLFDPRTNCQCAHALTVAAGDSFDWSTVPVPAGVDPWAAVAKAAVRAGITSQTFGGRPLDARETVAGPATVALAETVAYARHMATEGRS